MSDINSALLEVLTPYGTPERCGVVTKDGELLEIENIHPEPANGFHMEPKAFLQAVQDGAVATWHTHPGKDPNLSHEDLDGFRAWPMLDHHIAGVRDGEPAVHSFRVVGGIVLTV